MNHKLVIAEKPSVAHSLAAVISGGKWMACQLVCGPFGWAGRCGQL